MKTVWNLWNFGSGKAYVPEPLRPPSEPEVSAQGIFDLYGMLDKDTLDRVKEVINSIEPDKIKAVMKMIEPKDGEIKLTIDLRIRK